MSHVHESPKVMTVPLAILAAGAMFSGIGFYYYFVGDGAAAFWGDSILMLPENTVMADAHHVPLWVKLAPVIAGVAGIFVAYVFYMRRTELPASIAATHREAYQFLLNKWYFDEIYEVLLVRPAKWLGRLLWRGGDGRIIDGFGPDGIAQTVLNLARRSTLLQSGYVYHYAFAMMIGVAAMVTWYFTRLGGGQ